MNQYYNWDELLELGCPDGLVIQYITFTKQDINRWLYNDSMSHLIETMEDK